LLTRRLEDQLWEA